MTEAQSETHLFHDPFYDQWYCWDREWLICHGPFNDPIKAQQAAGYYIGSVDNMPPNCS